MIRRLLVSIVVIVGALSLAIGFTTWMYKNKPAPKQVDLSERALPVNTLVLEPMDRHEMIVGFGTARADRQATVTAEVSATVVELVNDLEVGVAVEAGQILIRLDDRQYRQDLAEAEGNAQAADATIAQLRVEQRNCGALLDIAESDLSLELGELERVRGLYEKEMAPKTEYDQARLSYQRALTAKQRLTNELALLEPRRLRAEAEKSSAKARSDRATLNIERCEIRAPFAGRIESISVDVGDRAQVGSPMLRIVSLDEIEIPLEVAVANRNRVSVGAKVGIVVESISDSQWHGTVARIAPTASVLSRTFEAYVEVDNREQETPLVPGLFVRAEVEGPLLADALIVPRGAIVEDHLFVIEDGKAKARKITIDRYLAEEAAISGNVRPGDVVITTNLDILYYGAPVVDASAVQQEEPEVVPEAEVQPVAGQPAASVPDAPAESEAQTEEAGQ